MQGLSAGKRAETGSEGQLQLGGCCLPKACKAGADDELDRHLRLVSGQATGQEVGGRPKVSAQQPALSGLVACW